MAGELVTVRLPRYFIYELLDGLKNEAQEWAETKEYMLYGVVDPQCTSVRECSDEKEAGDIESFYKQMIESIEEQI